MAHRADPVVERRADPLSLRARAAWSTIASVISLSRLLPFRRPTSAPRVRLFCFAYAGGAASLYRTWPQLLGPAVDVCPIELPGRGVRTDERPVSDLTALLDGLVDALAPLFDGTPIALFGHSLGARLAFELANRFDAPALAGDTRSRIVQLFASGSPAPGTRMRYGATGDRRPTAQLDDAEFLQRLRDLGGTPPEVLDDAELMALIAPVVRADFILSESTVEPHRRIPCPITAIAGTSDDGASPTAAAAWQPCTSAAFRLVEVDAGHFFLDSHRATLIREVQRDLAPWLA